MGIGYKDHRKNFKLFKNKGLLRFTTGWYHSHSKIQLISVVKLLGRQCFVKWLCVSNNGNQKTSTTIDLLINEPQVNRPFKQHLTLLRFILLVLYEKPEKPLKIGLNGVSYMFRKKNKVFYNQYVTQAVSLNGNVIIILKTK